MTTIYNPSKKFIFIHVHKCAGTAIVDGLRKFGGVSEWPAPRADSEKAIAIMDESNRHLESTFTSPEHFRAIDMQTYLGVKKYESYFSFAVSRNPWERLASWYYFLREMNQKSQAEIVRHLTMEDFINYSIDHFYLPQHHWLVDAKGSVIVDKIIKLEHLSTEWPKVTKKLSDERIDLRTMNASSNTKDPRPNPFSHVTPETMDRFIEAYKKDFELLGYSKDLRNIEALCAKAKVSEGAYSLYRELQSRRFYTAYDKERSSVSAADVIKMQNLTDKISKQKTALEKAQKANAVLRKKIEKLNG